ncbi:hypothetical protein D0860_05136 [Hortaea werneckii]|uniref:Uncharacterized protein n=1 Tax=Hortaea werneckii TaxID=91943 RepID=A0A3M7H2F0_HORWE|nr:hypothetical protein D0860_05136 [Hortaea werneckii]
MMGSSGNITQIDNSLAQYTNGEPWTNLGNYAHYINQHIIPLCDNGAAINSTACFGTQNESYWAEPSNSRSRSYIYSTCTENRDLPSRAPLRGPHSSPARYKSRIHSNGAPGRSRQGNTIGSLRCRNYGGNGGYEVVAERLARIDREQDVWLDLCYHSSNAPVRTTASAKEAEKEPQLLITGAGHHWDSYGILDVAGEPQFIREAHRWEIRTVRKWLDENYNGGDLCIARG